MNGLIKVSPTEIFEQKEGIVFSDIETFVRLVAEYLKEPRWIFRKRRFSSDRKIMGALVRNSNYALDNFRKLKYQWLCWNDGDIEAGKKLNRADGNGKYLSIVVARGINAVTKLIEEDGF